jgi:hypothetical protein
MADNALMGDRPQDVDYSGGFNKIKSTMKFKPPTVMTSDEYKENTNAKVAYIKDIKKLSFSEELHSIGTAEILGRL